MRFSIDKDSNVFRTLHKDNPAEMRAFQDLFSSMDLTCQVRPDRVIFFEEAVNN